MVSTKTFSNSDLAGLEAALNAFLATLAPKDVLDVLFSTESTGKYGITTTHVAMVVYRS